MPNFNPVLILVSFFLIVFGQTYLISQSVSDEAQSLLSEAYDASDQRAYADAKVLAKKGMDLYLESVPKDTVYYRLYDEWLYNTMYAGTTDTLLAYIDKYESDAGTYYGNLSKRGVQRLEHRANYYLVKGDYEQAIKHFEFQIQEIESMDVPNRYILNAARKNKARCYSRLYRLDDALSEYLEILENYRSWSDNGESNSVKTTLVNIGVVHWLKGDMEKAAQYNEDAYHMGVRLNGRFSGENLRPLSNLIIGCMDLREFEKGLKYVEEGIAVGRKLHGEKSEFVFRMYLSKATLLMDMAEYDKAEKALMVASDLLKGAEWGFINTTLEYYNVLGVVKQLQNNFPDAIEQFDKSLSLNTNDSGKQGLDGIPYYSSYYETTKRYGNCYKQWYKLDGGEEKLDSAVYYHTLLMDFFDYFREKNPSNYASTYSDLFQEVSWTYAEDYFLKNEYESALQIIEQHKTYSTISDITNQEIKFDGMQNSELDSMLALKANANDLEKELVSIEDEESVEYTQTLDSLQSVRVSYQELLSITKKENPELYALRFEPPTFTFNETQKKLAPNECVIEYSVSDTLVGIYVITSKSIEAKYIPSESMEALIAETYQAILNKEDVTSSLQEISSKLIEPVVQFISPEVSQLIIIPEWYLASFPFELLSIGDQQIIENYAISYSNSTLQYLQAKEEPSRGNGEIACFVPEYSGIDTIGFYDEEIPQFAELVRSGYHNLPGAKAESEAILETIPGQSFSGVQATKSTLMNDVKEYSVLHFAMHSEMNKDKPLHSALLFSSEGEESYEKLKALELYNESFNSDLVVLSACSSGYDRFNKGEGVLGFAKAFAYAGVPSLVYSIWKIPDQSSSYLMTRFYSHLSDGIAKDEALRQAKLDYLNDEAIPSSQKTPYYWAGFIASGNMSPISLDGGMMTNFSFIIGVLVLLLLGLFFRMKK